MAIQLVVVHADAQRDEETVINKAPCVPVVDSTVDTNWGIRRVLSLHYDFHKDNGECRVTVIVTH